jgi:bisphosphoglycerate-dependent phosphoglycerate mutase
MSGVLVLLRHGESTANAEDVFGGWLDFPLTNRGRDQAAAAGRMLRDAGIEPGAVHTSLLTRAIDPADILVAEACSATPPIRRSWRLNERHYGALQGRRRSDVRREFGAQIYADWRRSYHSLPLPSGLNTPTIRAMIRATPHCLRTISLPRSRWPRYADDWCRTGRTGSRPTSPPGKPHSWWRTAIRFAHCACISTA